MDMEIEEERESKMCHLGYSQEWSVWQLLDSVLPTGGYAPSFRLEAAMQARIVSTPEDLQTSVTQVLENTGGLLLPFVYDTTSHDIETWHRLDKILNAMLSYEVARKASTSQGSALLRIASAMFTELPSLKAMRQESLLGLFLSITLPSLGSFMGFWALILLSLSDLTCLSH